MSVRRMSSLVPCERQTGARGSEKGVRKRTAKRKGGKEEHMEKKNNGEKRSKEDLKLCHETHFPDHTSIEHNVGDLLLIILHAGLENLGKVVKDHLHK